MEYYVFVTNGCNLNCSYCSILIDSTNKQIPIFPQYNIDDLYNFIDAQQSMIEDNTADIIFFGGEPTLDYMFINDVINYARKRKLEYAVNFILHTNGLLLNEMPHEILINLEVIMVSINYLEIPKFNLGGSYFQKIVDNVRSVKKKRNIPIIGRFTITEESSLFTLTMQLHGFFDYVYWQLENCFSFSDFPTFYKTYSYEMNLLLEMWMRYLQSGIKLNFIPFLSCADYIVNRSESTGFCCGYNESMIYIQTDGVCYSCAEDFLSQKNVIGMISKGISFDTFSISDTICKDCEYLKLCRGRCGRMHREFSLEHIKQYCALNRIHFQYVSERADQIKSLAIEYSYDFEIQKHILSHTEYTP